MKVTILGLGYVGLVAAAGSADVGHEVLGVDVNQKKVQALQNGRVPFYEPGLSELVKQGLSNRTLRFSTPEDIAELNTDIVMIAVGTPSLSNGAADLSQVKSALKWVIENTVRPVVIVMKSTVPPGTGRKLTNIYLSNSTLEHQYVSNPEFLREGQALKDWYNPDRIVIGSESTEATEKVRKLYANIDAPVVTTNTTTAEMIKYAANAFLATKISFINEIANLCDLTGADIDGVTKGIALDPRIGPSFLKAGIGYGGSCFPKDVRALDFLSTVNGHSFELLKAVINVNNRQRLLPVQILKRELSSLSGKTIGVLGLAFKPNTDDTREAPSLDIIRLLIDEGTQVKAYDPMVKYLPKQHAHPDVTLASDAYDALNGCEALMLCTEWDEFLNLDWMKVRQHMKKPYLVVDGRNCLVPEVLRENGFLYYGIGRKK